MAPTPHTTNPPGRLGAIFRGWPYYLVAVVLPCLTLFVRVEADAWFSGRPLLVLFFLPVIVSAYVGGLGPGLTATLFTAGITEYFLATPRYSWQIENIADGVQWGIFVLSGVLISVLTEALRRARRRDVAVIAELKAAQAAQRETEGKLRESEAHYRAATADPGLILAQCDRNLRYTWISHAHPDFALEKFIGKRDDELLNSDGSRQLMQLKREVIESATRQRREITFQLSDGAQTFLITADPVNDGNGVVCGVATAAIDITERKRAEQAMRLQSAIVDTMAEGVVLVRVSDQAIVYANPRFEHMFGYESGEMVGLPVVSLNYDTSRQSALEAARDIIAQLEKTGEATCEVQNRRKDGSPFWCHARVSTLDHPLHGRIWVALHHDITAHKLAQAARGESEHRFHVVADSAPVLIWMAGIDKGCTWFNRAWLEFTGRSLQQELGEGWAEGVHPEDLPQCAAVYGQSFDARQRFSMEYRLRRHDGEFRWIQDTGVPRFDPDGAFVGYIGSCLDVTERRRMLQALEERTALFEAQLEATSEAILVVNERARIRYRNRRLVELFRVPAAVAADQDDAPLLRHVTSLMKDPEGFLAKVQALYAQQDATATDELALADGRQIVRFTAPVRDPGGRYYGRIWTFRDITDERLLEQRTLRAQRLEAVGRIAGGIAHDLNNILSPLLLAPSLLRDSLKAPADLETLDLVEASARRGADIVRQLLTFSRGTHGQRAPLDLRILLREMKHLALETFPRNLAVELELPDDLPPVLGNATEIHQILLNLCINARDAMPEGGVLSLRAQTAEVSVEQARDHPKARPGLAVVVGVSDSGHGIAPEVMERMYEPFFSTKGPSQGSGLGLSTVLGIVRSHEGVIECTSAPGRGTEFRVFFPVAPASSAPLSVTATDAPRSGRGEVILLVDDEAAVRAIVAASLRNSGYQVVTASDGRQALGMLAEGGGKFAAVLTDIAMPQMDGVQLIAEVRRLYPSLAVVAMTGMIADETRAELAALGVAKLLRKPFALTEALGAVRAALGRG